MSDSDDTSLLHEYCASRSEAAFTSLVRRHLPLVYHAALRRLTVPALAEEAAQNAFARLAVKAGSVARHPERLRAWLHRTAYLEACVLARKESRQARLPASVEPVLHDAMDRSEIYVRLDEQLNALPELDRELLLRHYCGGEEYRRIADAVGKSEAACKKRVERAILRLANALGGVGSAGVVAAALSTSGTQATAMPSAERVAATALRKGAGSSTAGALSGMAVAACIASSLTGGALGWSRGESVPSLHPGVPAEQRLLGGTVAAPLPPRPAPVVRSLDDVLESVQCERIGPLIDYLPRATVADLRALIAEDEPAGSHVSTARWLALKRWAEVDPAGGFDYCLAQERERIGYSMPFTTMMLAKWMRADSAGARKAFAALPFVDRSRLAADMVLEDETLADQLVAAHSNLFWAVESQRTQYPDVARQAAMDERIIAAALQRGGDAESQPFFDAFYQLWKKDPTGAIARAETIPSEELRSQVLANLREPAPYVTPKSDSFPPSQARTSALSDEMTGLMEQQPERVIKSLRDAPPGGERDAIYRAASRVMAGSDPWKLFAIVTDLRGSVGNWENHIERALKSAGKEDPVRALAAIPGLAPRIRAREHNEMPILEMTKNVIEGWMERDFTAALRWVAASESPSLINDVKLRMNGTGHWVEPLIAMLDNPTENERHMAQWGLKDTVAEAVLDGTAAEILAKIPRRDADDILERWARWRFDSGKTAEAEAFVSLMSPDRRAKALPQHPEP
ncbi:MAG TPA: sigma-70 family RNA polymerase sigma factor [Verrucomicrobiales bacterium]|nr:sigma-70 family RNA polymerase sigma factor [Verrucomicrobiales bacterium]